jgi:hypothetical protein
VVLLAALVLAVALTAAGCAAASGAGSGSASPSATKTIDVSYTNGVITPPPDKVIVPIGTAVHLVVRLDVADEVHNHYDNVEKEVPPGGGTVTFDFVAQQPGVYEVELHKANKQLLQLQIQ